MAFTSWTQIVTDLKTAYANGSWMQKRVKVGDSEMEFRSVNELLKFLQEAESRAAQETNTSYSSRVVMFNGGDGLR